MFLVWVPDIKIKIFFLISKITRYENKLIFKPKRNFILMLNFKVTFCLIIIFSFIKVANTNACPIKSADLSAIYGYLGTNVQYNITTTKTGTDTFNSCINFNTATLSLVEIDALKFRFALGNPVDTLFYSDTGYSTLNGKFNDVCISNIDITPPPAGCTTDSISGNTTCTFNLYAFNGQTNCKNVIYAKNSDDIIITEENTVSFTFTKATAGEQTLTLTGSDINLNYVLSGEYCSLTNGGLLETDWSCSSDTLQTFNINDKFYGKLIVKLNDGSETIINSSSTLAINKVAFVIDGIQIIIAHTDIDIFKTFNFGNTPERNQHFETSLLPTATYLDTTGALATTTSGLLIEVTVSYPVTRRVLRNLQDDEDLVNMANFELKILNEQTTTDSMQDSTLIIIIVCVIVGVLIVAIIVYCVCRGNAIGKDDENDENVDIELSKRSGATGTSRDYRV